MIREREKKTPSGLLILTADRGELGVRHVSRKQMPRVALSVDADAGQSEANPHRPRPRYRALALSSRSTRRFCSRPAIVSLPVIGWASP